MDDTGLPPELTAEDMGEPSPKAAAVLAEIVDVLLYLLGP